METQRTKFTILELVYPPISNQEAEWLMGDPEVEERLRTSDFYLIGARQVTSHNANRAGPERLRFEKGPDGPFFI